MLFPGRIGTRFTLGLRGTQVTPGAASIAVKVTAVRWWPNGRWTPLSRVVSLRLPAGSPLAKDGTRAGASRSSAAQRLDGELTVFTGPAKVTKEALRGDDGALRATRIRQADGTMLDLEPKPDGPPEDEPADDGDGETEAPPRPF
jgi:hypothetical protein